MSIEVKNLFNFFFKQKTAYDISFKVGKGEIVGFLGPNGAGKSTTMKIITGYLQQTAGEAFVSGINVNEEPLQTKRKIGYLPESNALYYDMYVREYLGFVAEVHQISQKQQAIDKAIETVKLNVEAICDRVIIINKGQLVADDKLTNLRKNSTGQTKVILELKETVDEEVMSSVFGKSVSRINPNSWRFDTHDPEKLKKEILQLTLQNNLNIVSLQSETTNLEDVFRGLTA